eukprot:374657-Pleurochrysis_carterae.AAC.1
MDETARGVSVGCRSRRASSSFVRSRRASSSFVVHAAPPPRSSSHLLPNLCSQLSSPLPRPPTINASAGPVAPWPSPISLLPSLFLPSTPAPG